MYAPAPDMKLKKLPSLVTITPLSFSEFIRALPMKLIRFTRTLSFSLMSKIRRTLSSSPVGTRRWVMRARKKPLSSYIFSIFSVASRILATLTISKGLRFEVSLSSSSLSSSFPL